MLFQFSGFRSDTAIIRGVARSLIRAHLTTDHYSRSIMHLSTGADAGRTDAVPQMTRTGVYSARIRGRETRQSKHLAAEDHIVHSVA